MLGSDCFDGLQLDQNLPLNKKIGVKIANDLRSKQHFNGFLPLDGKAGFKKGDVKCFFVNRLQKPRALFIQHSKGTANDLTGQLRMKPSSTL